MVPDAHVDAAEYTTETLRSCIERGGCGDFAQALLQLFNCPSDVTFDRAYAVADRDNRKALRHVAQLVNVVREQAVCNEFPGLHRLDEPVANPHEIPLRGDGNGWNDVRDG